MAKKNIEREELSYSASEMHSLILNFSLIAGELILENDVWLYYLKLREMLNILMCKKAF